ncbi:hypothetical protein J6590_000760 [Homalodisca vitripennis]|nr:hypothetical protein J6590_000760 [Homalodisca vitripennis]
MVPPNSDITGLTQPFCKALNESAGDRIYIAPTRLTNISSKKFRISYNLSEAKGSEETNRLALERERGRELCHHK